MFAGKVFFEAFKKTKTSPGVLCETQLILKKIIYIYILLKSFDFLVVE